MRLVEFLILLLEAHAQSLQQLAAFLGEEELLQILEDYGDRFNEITQGQIQSRALEFVEKLSLEEPLPDASSSTYQELEGSVHEFQLPAVLEFHLWTYPFYRALIESSHDLNARIPRSSAFQSNSIGSHLVDEAMAQASAWIRHIPFPPQICQHAEKAASDPWLRFRTNALKRIGKRPLGPVY